MRIFPLGVLLLGALLRPAAAFTFTNDGLFGAKNQSVWASGPGFTLDSGPQFFGSTWDLGKTVGGVTETCVLGACASFGAKIGADTKGRVGIGYGLKVDSGTFDVQYPARATFSIPNTVSGTTIGAITIGSSFAALPSVQVQTSAAGALETRSPTLQVRGPTAQAYVDLAAELHAFAGAEVCVGVCYGPAFAPPDINASREIAAINRGNDGQIRVLGEVVAANKPITALNGLLNASVSIPNLDSSSKSTSGGFNGTNLTSSQRSNVAAVRANIAQIAADAVGFPIALSGKAGPIGYNLFQAGVGAALDVQQILQFTPTATGSYIFSSDVKPRINGIDGALTNRIDFKFGDDVTFSPGQVSSVSIEPLINLTGTVRNQTDLVIAGDVDVTALGVDVAGLSLGPLVDEHKHGIDIGRINLLTKTFAASLGTVAGAPITLDFAACANRISGSGEFLNLGLCASSGYNRGLTDLNPDGTRQDEIEAFKCGPQTLAGPGVCGQFPSGETSAYLPRPGGDLFFSDTSPLPFDPTSPGPGSSNRSDFGLLTNLGFTGDVPPFAIPAGDPLSAFAVPEPGTWPMLAGALVALVGCAITRSGRCRPPRAPNSWAAPCI